VALPVQEQPKRESEAGIGGIGVGVFANLPSINGWLSGLRFQHHSIPMTGAVAVVIAGSLLKELVHAEPGPDVRAAKSIYCTDTTFCASCLKARLALFVKTNCPAFSKACLARYLPDANGPKWHSVFKRPKAGWVGTGSKDS